MNSDMITWVYVYLSFQKLSLLKSLEISLEVSPVGNYFLMHLSIKSSHKGRESLEISFWEGLMLKIENYFFFFLNILHC